MRGSGPAQNVIVFGECGVGKSSIVNLIVGSQVAKTSPDANACTTRTEHYDVVINGRGYRLWDTAGLDGGSFGFFRAAITERNLRTCLQSRVKKNEPSLLVYCVRASRATRAMVRHYWSVRSATGERTFPMVLVVTGLENARGDMEDWWRRNAVELSSHGMDFVDHACITSIDDDPRDPVLARTRRGYSQDTIRNLIFRNCVSREEDTDIPQLPGGKRVELRGRTRAAWTCLASALLRR